MKKILFKIGHVPRRIRLMIIRFWRQWVKIFNNNSIYAAISLIVPIILVSMFVGWMIDTAPSRTITITAGGKGSIFYRQAERYQKLLAQSGIKLVILESEGSLDNLKRLADKKQHVDIGFVQSGLAKAEDFPDLVSLGSISYQPLYVFYRINDGEEEKSQLNQFKGQRLVIGPEGSGVRALALALLAQNKIADKESGTTLLNYDDTAAVNALQQGTVDAIFLMGESASTDNMVKIRKNPNMRILSFSQAESYVRRISYLNKIHLPMGGLDIANNIPGKDIELIGPAVEIIARNSLHPALSDMILEAAKKIHSKPGLLRDRDQFPAPLEQDIPISDAASRFYTSGKTLLYRYLPFNFARALATALTVLLPLLLVFIPILRIIPFVFRWTVETRIYRWYGCLLNLENEANQLFGTAPPTKSRHKSTPLLSPEQAKEKYEEIINRLNFIETNVNHLTIATRYADSLYNLRAHVMLVKQRIANAVNDIQLS